MAAPHLLLSLLLLVTPFFFVDTATKLKKLPPFVRKCSAKDPELEKCAVESAREVLPRLVKGVPAFHIPNLDPLTVPEVHIQTGSAPSTLDMHCRNIVLRGIAKTELLDIGIDQKNQIYSTHCRIPLLHIESDYTVDGRVLLLPVTGSGKGNITFENAYMYYEQKFDLEKKGDHYFLKFPPSSAKFNCSRAHFHFDNLFNGDPTLGNTVNAFLNENWRAVVDDLGQPFVDAAAQVIRQFASAVVIGVPFDEIFTDVELP